VAKGFKIEAKGLRAFSEAEQVVFDAVKEAMDDIKDDVVEVSSSLAPHKTGKLEKSHYTRRSYKNLANCTFSLRYRADNKGFDYASWTHDADYKLGEGSQQKRPAHSRFAKGSLRVGSGYVSQVIDASQEQWDEFVAYTIDRKLKASLKKNSKR